MEIDTNILNANEFENDFDDDFSFDVQKRGQEYYHNEKVLWVSKNKDNEFYAKVNGKNDNQYFVKIIIIIHIIIRRSYEFTRNI